MKMAKRILSLVLVLAMIACLSVTAFADGTSNTATDEGPRQKWWGPLFIFA